MGLLNSYEVELFVNGNRRGSQKMTYLGHVEWKVRYEPGAIEARARRTEKSFSQKSAKQRGLQLRFGSRLIAVKSMRTTKMWPS